MSDGPAVSRPAVGWHGKLPALGDFTTRGLDDNFVEVWDGWMSSGLSRMRADSPDDWIAAYLSSATWRFIVTPRFLPAPLSVGMWTGVVMPSVDRVGRYYPLTLAGRLNGIPRGQDGQNALWSWLQRLQDAAIDALQDDWSVAALDKELLRLGLPPQGGAGEDGAAVSESVSDQPANGAAPHSMAAFFSACHSACEPTLAQGQCIWVTENEDYEPRLLQSDRLDDSISRLWSD
mgnify:CR=1 FL=1